MLVHFIIFLALRFQPTLPFTPNPTPQSGCNRHCITEHLHAKVLVRARSSKCCGEQLVVSLGTFQTLGIVDIQRQLDLAFGYTTHLTYQSNTTHLHEPLSTDLQLIAALSSSLATKIWFTNGNDTPLVQLTITAQQVPKELVALAVGGDHVNSFIWQLASRVSGDPLAKVDVRLDRLLVGHSLTKEDVGIEIPRGSTDSSSMHGTTTTPHHRGPSPVSSSFATPIALDNVIVGILIDRHSKYLQQALRFLSAFQQNIINSNGHRGSNTMKVLVCVLPGVPDLYQTYLQSTFPFIVLRGILPLSHDLPNATPHSNKLRLLEQPECNPRSASYQPLLHSKHQYCIYMDTDVLVLNDDLFSYIHPNQSTLQFRAGRTLWAQTASNDPAWHRMFELAGVVRANKDSYPLASHWPNTGVLIFPTRIVPQFLFDWMHYTDKTLKWLTAFKQDVYFTETISFLLTMLMTTDFQYELLPVQMNAQMNLPKFDFKRNGYDQSLLHFGDASVLHYPLDTIVMDDTYHIPQPYPNETVLHFPFLAHVNKDIRRLHSAMEQIMRGWTNAVESEAKKQHQ